MVIPTMIVPLLLTMLSLRVVSIGNCQGLIILMGGKLASLYSLGGGGEVVSTDLGIGYITRGRSLRDLHTRGPRGNVNHRRDRLPSDATYLYHGKSIEHLARFEDRNSVWPKLMVSYKFLLKYALLALPVT